ncbi:MAG: biotin/lipoyl-containing protein [Verrucomicrobiales bacterium]
MPAYITMPKLADTMEAGTLVKWKIKEGDTVEMGDIVAEIETDKATMEMESFEEGKVHRLYIEEGKQVPIGYKLALILEDGEDPPDNADNPDQPDAPAAKSDDEDADDDPAADASGDDSESETGEDDDEDENGAEGGTKAKAGASKHRRSPARSRKNAASSYRKSRGPTRRAHREKRCPRRQAGSAKPPRSPLRLGSRRACPTRDPRHRA